MKEQKTVLSTQVNGETAIVMPITKLECIEDTATSVDSASDTDYIPVIDSADEGQMKKITVGNLLAGVSEVANAAKSTAETAQAAASVAASSSIPVAFSIEAAAWTELAEQVVGRGYSAEIAADGVTDVDFPDVYFDKDSIVAADASSILADTAANSVILYAKTKPTATLSGSYFVRKGS